MKIKNILIVLTISLFAVLNARSQTIYRSWCCQESHNLCLNINEKGYSSIDELEWVKFKVKGNKLKVKVFHNPYGLISRKTVYWFVVEKLTDDTLVLSQNMEKNQFEHMYEKTITFIALKEKCDYRVFITPK